MLFCDSGGLRTDPIDEQKLFFTYENGAMGFIHLEDRAVLVQNYEVYLYPIMSAPLFQASRMSECRAIFSHSTVV